MLTNIKSNIENYLLFLMLLIFVVYKIPHLYEPLFWDGLGVYGRSIFTLIDTEIGFQPKYLEPNMSRGHPMLYVYLTALFTNFFGSDIFAMHLFNLVVAVITLFSTYYIGAKLWTKRIGLFASLLLVSQALFIAQSVTVLPEMMLALFLLWSVYFFLKEQWLLYFIAVSLALMTKETAVYLPPVLAFILFFWNLLFYKKWEFKKCFIIASPFLTFFAFLLLQKVQNGWYFFPYHDPFEGDKGFFDLQLIISKFKNFQHFVLNQQGRNYLTLIALIPFVLGFFIWNNKDKYKLIVFIGAILGLFLFSSTSYYMNRYMLSALPFYVLLISFTIYSALKSRLVFQYLLVFFFMTCTLFQYNSNKFTYDENMSYLKFVDFQKELTVFLEQQEDWKDGLVITCNFPLNYSFQDKRYGYSSRNYEIEMHSEVELDSEYIIFTNPGSWKNYTIPENYTQIPFPDKGYCSAKIYKKN